MTKIQRRKQARHNAAKDQKRRKLTEAEMDARFADLRKQVAEANERIQEKTDNLEQIFYDWTETYNSVTAPAISLACLLAVCRVSKKYMAAGIRNKFLEDICVGQQDLIDQVGNGETSWKLLKDELENDYGFEVPLFASIKDELEELEKRRAEEREAAREESE